MVPLKGRCLNNLLLSGRESLEYFFVLVRTIRSLVRLSISGVKANRLKEQEAAFYLLIYATGVSLFEILVDFNSWLTNHLHYTLIIVGIGKIFLSTCKHFFRSAHIQSLGTQIVSHREREQNDNIPSKNFFGWRSLLVLLMTCGAKTRDRQKTKPKMQQPWRDAQSLKLKKVEYLVCVKNYIMGMGL